MNGNARTIWKQQQIRMEIWSIICKCLTKIRSTWTTLVIRGQIKVGGEKRRLVDIDPFRLHSLPMRTETISRSSTPTEEYTSEIPADFIRLASVVTTEDGANSKAVKGWEKQQPQPPSLPPHLDKILLNSQAVSEEDNSVLPEPNHVTLNHLYATSIKDNVMALSTTTRYRKKVRKEISF